MYIKKREKVFNFLCFQLICKFCLVYHVPDLNACKGMSKQLKQFLETYVFCKFANSIQIFLLNFIHTVKPGYIERSRETEIGSI